MNQGTWKDGVYTCVVNGIKCKYDDERHLYTIGDRPVPGVTGILKNMGFIDYSQYPEGARERGQRVHLATELLDKGVLDWATVADEDIDYVMAWEKAKKELEYEPIETEVPRFNTIYYYAGRPDRGKCWITVKGRRFKALIDLKSGGFEPWTAMQLAGYQALFPEEQYLPRIGVQLKPDTRFQIHEFKDRNDQKVFLGLVPGVHWKRNNLRKGGPHGGGTSDQISRVA